MRGRRARLFYLVGDDSGVTKDTITVHRGGRTIGRIVTPFGPAIPGFVYYVRWPVPRTAPSRLRFCVRSMDRDGNRSKRSCARLLVRG